ncbi:MAG: 2-oxoglutarate dehydrogenase complex dihydrolipoyllysine-residue succinyltransferase [Phycisphaerales bacterium]|nr:2-oxoglutarate dehydrogenase complex dihydrolipoyllysine-residue succinyltransferase [Phycisphaerales bacterium]
MTVNIQVPSLGESITQVRLGRWMCQSGQWVERDQPLVELESDKVTQELPSPAAGLLTITAKEGDDVPVGGEIGSIDTEAAKPAASPASDSPADIPATRVEVATETSASMDAPRRASGVARRMAADQGINLHEVQGSGPSGRIMKSDLMAPTPTTASEPLAPHQPAQTGIRRERLSPLRQRIAERLVLAQRTAAMLTTFNEVDMTEVIKLRSRYKDDFHDRFGVKLGFMSFFAKATVSALQAYPAINGWIDGDAVEYHDYVNLSIAVGTDRGLVVPVVRDAQNLDFSEMERDIAALAEKARNGRLSMEDMQGGTFTISNGGVYGSMMSTPILNPPQSGILGLHRIAKRAVEDPDQPGQIALRPMMYLAVSYDHRIVDGSEAVQFLVHIKECIEAPHRMLLGM